MFTKGSQILLYTFRMRFVYYRMFSLLEFYFSQRFAVFCYMVSIAIVSDPVRTRIHVMLQHSHHIWTQRLLCSFVWDHFGTNTIYIRFFLCNIHFWHRHYWFRVLICRAKSLKTGCHSRKIPNLLAYRLHMMTFFSRIAQLLTVFFVFIDLRSRLKSSSCSQERKYEII